MATPVCLLCSCPYFPYLQLLRKEFPGHSFANNFSSELNEESISEFFKKYDISECCRISILTTIFPSDLEKKERTPL